MWIFKIGFIGAYSLMLIAMLALMTLGFYNVPKGPVVPTVPAGYYSNPPVSSGGYSPAEAQQLMQQQAERQAYDNKMKIYEEQAKAYEQAQLIPYIRNVVIILAFVILIYEVAGVMIYKFSNKLLGEALVVGGLVSIIGTPIVMTMLSTVVNSGRYAASLDFTSIIQAGGIVSLLGVVILSALITVFYKNTQTAMLQG